MSVAGMPMPWSRTEIVTEWSVPSSSAHFDRTAFVAELDGIGDQIEQDLQHQLGVGAHDHMIGAGLGTNGDASLLPPGFAHADAFRHHLDEVDLAFIQGELVGFRLGEIENVVDDGKQMMAAVGDVLDVGGVAGIADRRRTSPCP